MQQQMLGYQHVMRHRNETEHVCIKLRLGNMVKTLAHTVCVDIDETYL